MGYEPDYYAILHLDFNCSQGEIREQFKKMVKVFHPDRHNGDPWCDEQLRICNKAYEILGDPIARASYDKRLAGIPAEPIFDFGTKPGHDSDDHHPDQDPAWTFEASPEPERVIDPSQLFVNIPADQRTSTIFKSTGESPTFPNPIGSFKDTSWRNSSKSTRALIILGVVALIAVGGLVGSIGNQTVKHLSLVDSQAPADQTDDTAVTYAKLPITLPAVQTNLNAATSAVKATEQKTRIIIAPYWQRYQRDESTASKVVDTAERQVDQMHEVALNTESQMLQETSTEIQDQFDDLSYGADSGSEKEATSRLTAKLDDYEEEIAQIKALTTPDQKYKNVPLNSDPTPDPTPQFAATPPDLSLSDPSKSQTQ